MRRIHLRGGATFHCLDEPIARMAECLVYRLQAKRAFAQNGGRANFRLDGMDDQPRDAQAMPGR